MGKVVQHRRDHARHVEASDIKDLLGPIGESGTTFFKGYYNIYDDFEYVSELKSSNALTTYNKMRRSDGQVRLALLALESPVINADWKLHPPGDPEHDDLPSDQELEVTERINEWIFGDDFQFTDTLRQILSMYWAGFSLFEKIYGVSDDNLLLCKRLAPRLQNTIQEWRVEEGQLKAVRQVIYAGETKRDVWLPGDKVVCFTFQREGDDFRGISALRPAYKHWFHKDFFYRIGAMQIERWGLGVPVVRETDVLTTKGRKDTLIEAVKNMRAHEQGYVYVPRGYEVELLDSGAGKMIDPLPSIQHHDQAILKTIMAQFFEFGQTETGSRSVGETMKNQYLLSLQCVADMIADKINKEVISPVVNYNWPDTIRPPYLHATGIQPEDVELLSRAFNSLGNSGLVTKGPKLEGYIRELFGMPTEDEEPDEDDDEITQPMPAIPDEDLEEDKEDPPVQDVTEEAEREEVEPLVASATTTNLTTAKTLAAPPPFAPKGEEVSVHFEFWRPLTEQEQYLSLRAMTGKLDDSREEVVRVTRDSREQLINEVMPQIAEAYQKADPELASEIDYSDELAEKMEAEIEVVLWDIYEFGYQQVNIELDRQKKRAKTLAFPGETDKEKLEKIKKLAKAKAKAAREIALDKMIDLAREWAQKAIRTGTLDPVAIRDEMESFSENTMRRSAGYTINTLNAMGRDAALREREDEIEYVEYSAILDNNVCDPCFEVDQRKERYIVGSPEFEQLSPPLSRCEGGDQCRCVWVTRGKTERPEA